MNIAIKKGQFDGGVKVRNENTPSLTKVAEQMRDLTSKDYRIIKRLAKQQRKLDKVRARLNDPHDIYNSLELLNNREFRQAFKLTDTLRNSDKELAKAQVVEKRAKQARFEQAQLEVR